jgi:hypothetical protein
MYRLLLALKPCFKMLEQFSVNKETELNSTARLGGAEERNRRAGRVVTAGYLYRQSLLWISVKSRQELSVDSTRANQHAKNP